MATENITAEIKVSCTKEQMVNFLKLIGHMELLGRIGSSREIKVAVDGDGSARMKFQVKVDGKYTDLPKGTGLDQDGNGDATVGFA